MKDSVYINKSKKQIALFLGIICFVSLLQSCSSNSSTYSTKNMLSKIGRNADTNEVIFDNGENKYRSTYRNEDGTLSTYIFSIPIKSDLIEENKKTSTEEITLPGSIKNEYNDINDYYQAYGVDSTIMLPKNSSNAFAVRNMQGEMKINFSNAKELDGDLKTVESVLGDSKRGVSYGNLFCYNSYNGIGMEITYTDLKNISDINLDIEYFGQSQDLYIEKNEKYQSIMFSDRNPFALFQNMFAYITYEDGTSKIETLDGSISSSENNKFDVRVRLDKYKETNITSITVCMNAELYVAKSVFDTTVQSKKPDRNYAYLNYAFVGNSEDFDEQWYYVRIDPAAVSYFTKEEINNCYLYIHSFKDGKEPLEIYTMEEDWCSFASTWNTKIPHGNKIGETEKQGNYIRINFTEILKRMIDRGHEDDPGIVIKAKESDLWMLATGDNTIYPCVLEVNIKETV